MNRKLVKDGVLAIFTFLLVCAYVSTVYGADNVILDSHSVVDLALKRSLGIKRVKLDEKISFAGIGEAKSTFDTSLNMYGNYELDKSKKLLSMFGDRTDTFSWGMSLSKKFSSGTSLGLSFDSTRSKTYNSSIGGTIIIPQDAMYEPAIGASLSQSIMNNFFGINDRRRVKSAKLMYLSSKYAVRRNVESMVYGALLDYWNLAFIKRNIVARERMVNFASAFLSAVKKNLELGTAEHTDLLAAKANLLRRKSELLISRQVERLAEERLKSDLELPPSEPIQLKREKIKMVNSTDFYIKDAFKNRGDYQALKEI